MDLHVLRVVLLHEVECAGVRERVAVFRVQRRGLCRVWTLHGHRGVSDGLRFREEDLRVRPTILPTSFVS